MLVAQLDLLRVGRRLHGPYAPSRLQLSPRRSTSAGLLVPGDGRTERPVDLLEGFLVPALAGRPLAPGGVDRSLGGVMLPPRCARSRASRRSRPWRRGRKTLPGTGAGGERATRGVEKRGWPSRAPPRVSGRWTASVGRTQQPPVLPGEFKRRPRHAEVAFQQTPRGAQKPIQLRRLALASSRSRAHDAALDTKGAPDKLPARPSRPRLRTAAPMRPPEQAPPPIAAPAQPASSRLT